MKINRKLILILVLIVCMGVVVSSCNNKDVEFEGVKNKELTKDLTKLRDLIIESIKDSEYKEDKIEKILKKINGKEYQQELNNLEILLINDINTFKEDIKHDLNSGKKLITSSTYEKINWLLQATTEKP